MTADVLKVWPAPGRRVRDPANGLLLTRRGATVPDSPYWRRRLATGDVVRDQGNGQKVAVTMVEPSDSEKVARLHAVVGENRPPSPPGAAAATVPGRTRTSAPSAPTPSKSNRRSSSAKRDSATKGSPA